MTKAPLRRSVLYTPASNARALEKVAGLDCDAVIIDLEDAVAPAQKAAARDLALKTLPVLKAGGQEVVLRCNGLDTPWGAEDIAALAKAAPDAVLIPKIGDVADIARYAALLPEAVPLWVMIETCAAVLSLPSIAYAPPLQALVFGANDLMAQMGARDPSALSAARAMTVTAARAGGLTALDGVHNAIGDEAGLAAACAEAAAYGFDGKTLIHPNQIAICNAAFSPTPAQLTWARAVIAAFNAPPAGDAGVLSLDGVMMERLHLAQARRLIAAHEVASGA